MTHRRAPAAAACCRLLLLLAGADAGRLRRDALRSQAPAAGANHSALRSQAPAVGANHSASVDAIPSVVYFTGPWEPMRVVERNKAVVAKGTEFRYYDYSALDRSVSEISASLEAVGVHGASRAFHELRPRAYRTDLWRYMVLWQNGGIYIDAKMTFRAPVSAWVDQAKDSFVACYDVPKDDVYWTAMLAARKHNPTLLAVIKRIISNTQERWYPPSWLLHSDLETTGPGMLTSVLRAQPPAARPRVSCRLTGTPSGLEVVRGPRDLSRSYRLAHPDSVVAVADNSEHAAMRSCRDCDSYADLYKRHQVYCSEPGPECKFTSFVALLAAPYWSYVV